MELFWTVFGVIFIVSLIGSAMAHDAQAQGIKQAQTLLDNMERQQKQEEADRARLPRL